VILGKYSPQNAPKVCKFSPYEAQNPKFPRKLEELAAP
jgi:hypothetical protein